MGEIERNLERVIESVLDEMGLETRDLMEEVVTDAQVNFVPVDDGDLRGSGRADGPVDNEEGLDIVSGAGFGLGVSEGYALIQHQDPNFRHEVGTDQYLTIPFNDQARSGHTWNSLVAAGKRGLSRAGLKVVD